jgi:hypothetical protein
LTNAGVVDARIKNESTQLQFETGTSGTPKMVITSGGLVGIGTTSPNHILNVAQSNSADLTNVSFDNTAGAPTNAGTQGTILRLKAASSDNVVRTMGAIASYAMKSTGAGANNNGDLRFYTGAEGDTIERMRITSGGNVSVNTTQQLGQLNVKRSASGSTARTLALYNNVEASVNTGVSIEFYPNNGDDDRCARISSVQSISGLYADLRFFTSNNALPVERMKISESGTTFIYSVYSQTSASAANVIVGSDGNLFRSTSSLKYKKDVVDYTKGLAEVMKLRPVNYQGKNEIDGDKVFAGLIAEEVHDAGLTEFVQYAEDGSPDALAYQNMVALLTKAIQELKAENDQQKADIESLKALINK